MLDHGGGAAGEERVSLEVREGSSTSKVRREGNVLWERSSVAVVQATCRGRSCQIAKGVDDCGKLAEMRMGHHANAPSTTRATVVRAGPVGIQCVDSMLQVFVGLGIVTGCSLHSLHLHRLVLQKLGAESLVKVH